LFASGAAQALAGEFDAMRVVHEAVQNGVGVSGVAEYRRARLWCMDTLTPSREVIVLEAR
jgi:hypothetical protein